MKKIFLAIVSLLLVTGGGIYLFKGQLWDMAAGKLTADMYLSADTDGFDPGLSLGSSFPAIKANYQGEEITNVTQFIHDKGMIFIANRSADW